jgi:MFS family permease
MVVMGISQAKNTGTVDSWQVEQINKKRHQEIQQSYLSIFEMAMAAFIALGAVMGGYLPELIDHSLLGVQPNWNMVAVLIEVGIHLMVSPFLFKEGESKVELSDEQRSVKGQIKIAVRYGLRNSTIRLLLLAGLVIGMAVANIESFWQPQLISIDDDVSYSVFGWITMGYFATAIVGPILTGILGQVFGLKPRVFITVLPALSATAVYFLAAQNTIPGFVVFYFGFMLTFSMINPAVSTELNAETPDDVRSTMLSVFSLSFMGGAVFSAYVLAPLAKSLGISQVWQIVAMALALYSLLKVFQWVIQTITRKLASSVSGSDVNEPLKPKSIA